MALTFTTAHAEAKANGVKMLVYGRAGVGKTVLCATAPVPLILSAEAGLLSLSAKNLKRLHGIEDDIAVVKINSLADLTEVYDRLEKGDKDADFAGFESVCLDSVSEIGELVLVNALKQVPDPRMAYGELYEKMTRTLKLFRDLPNRHVLFVAKEKANKDGHTPLHIAAMPGNQVGAGMPYLFDEVFHLDVGKTPEGVSYRFLQTNPDVNYDAKDRSGCLDAIEEPNLTKIIAKIQNE